MGKAKFVCSFKPTYWAQKMLDLNLDGSPDFNLSMGHLHFESLVIFFFFSLLFILSAKQPNPTQPTNHPKLIPKTTNPLSPQWLETWNTQTWNFLEFLECGKVTKMSPKERAHEQKGSQGFSFFDFLLNTIL